MALPHNDSLVTFPAGVITERATVLSVTTGDEQTLVLTDVTPFHPLDSRWPDQGPDRGTLAIGGQTAPVIDCVIGATDGSALYLSEVIPVPRGEPGWAFVVVHVLPPTPPALAEGDEVTLVVDGAHRAALSAGHTGCHAAALALNAALASRWRKPADVDDLGNPDFDRLALVSSRIEPDRAVDRYRIGRTLRKKGFDVGGLADELPAITAAANQRLAGWVAADPPVQVQVSGPRLTDRREWVCELPEGTARIPCGGTHLHSLGELSAIGVELGFDQRAGELSMVTSVRRDPA